MFGAITAVPDKQQPRSWLERTISSLCVPGISQLKEHKVDLNIPFTAPDFNAIRFQENCFLQVKQLISNMRVWGKMAVD